VGGGGLVCLVLGWVVLRCLFFFFFGVGFFFFLGSVRRVVSYFLFLLVSFDEFCGDFDIWGIFLVCVGKVMF